MRRNVLPASRVAPLLFFSGACALVYQVAWLKELRLIFGASTASSAAVLGVFMGGLGVGGLFLGRRAERRDDPLMLYATLEAGVAVSAAITPLVVRIARGAYLASGGSGTLGAVGATAARLALAVLVLGLPTYLMGGTLPAAARAVTTRGDVGRRGIGLLYGVNTLGAVAGALAANFVLLEVFGTRLTLWLAALVNLLVAVAARGISRSAEPEGEVPMEPGASGALAAAAPLASWVPPAAAGVAGFAFLLMELVWYRMLAPVLGGSSYTFGLILAVALLGIGLGGALYSRRPPDVAPTIAGFAVTCALEALFLGIPYALGDRLAILSMLLRPLGALGLSGHVAAWGFVASIVVLPAAIVSGYQFPLVIGLFGADPARVARHVGLAYAANTLGSIVGSLAGGFGLVPAVGALGCWRLAGWLLAGSGLLAAGIGSRRSGRGVVALAVVASLLAAVAFRAEGPTAAWRHSPIGAGRADDVARGASTNSLRQWRNERRSMVRWEQDGVESAVALANVGGDSFVVNGKTDGHAIADAGTQVMSGLVGAALHGAPRRSLVIGLGTGSTAGWLGRVPSMEQVDVIELEPAILRVAADLATVNEHVLENPKVHIAIGDAREHVLVRRDTYDLVFSEPSNPYRAGISSLYTREFYEAAAQRLAPGGFFLQWIQAYEVDGRAIRIALATLHAVFPHVTAWSTTVGDVLLVAGRETLRLSMDDLRQRLSQEPYRRAMIATWGTSDAEGFLAHFVAGEDLWRLANAGEDLINTDDRNQLEYAFARTVGRGALRVESALFQLSAQGKIDRPPVLGLDDLAFERRKDLVMSARRGFVPARPEQRRWIEAVVRYTEGGDLRAPLLALRRAPRALESPLEIEMIAECLAQAGDVAAEPMIENVRAWSPTAADAILARLRHAQKRPPAEVGALLVSAFEGLRASPWVRMPIVERTLVLAQVVAAADHAVGRRLYDALGPRFAVGLLDADRLHTRLEVALKVDKHALCVDALGAYEPHVPWNRPFLEERYGCYHTQQAPLEGVAQAELLDFVDAEPLALSPTVEASPSPPTAPATPGAGAAPPAGTAALAPAPEPLAEDAGILAEDGGTPDAASDGPSE